MRRIKNGEILFKSQMQSSIAKILVSTFQGEDNAVLVVDISGGLELFTVPSIIDDERRKTEVGNDVLRKIENKKDTFALELNVLNQSQSKALSISDCVTQSVIPRAAKISIQLRHSHDGLCMDIDVNYDLKIYLVVLLSDGMFPNNESKIEMATAGASSVTITLGTHSCSQTEICVKASVSYPGSKILHVLEDLIDVPKFAQFSQVDTFETPRGRVQFHIVEREQRMHLWIRDNFILNKPVTDEKELRYSFISPLSEKLNIFMKDGEVLIETDTIKTAADIVQSMASYFAFKMLRSDCSYDEIKKIPSMFTEIQALQNSLSQIDTDIAELGMVRLDRYWLYVLLVALVKLHKLSISISIRK